MKNNTFKGDFYARRAEARRRIQNWLEAQRYKGKHIDTTPPAYRANRNKPWREFKSQLLDDVCPPYRTISEKLAEAGLSESEGELIKQGGETT